MVAVVQGRSGIRLMREDDIAEIIAIEEAEYEFGWTEGIFRDCIRVGYLGLVYLVDSAVAGYGVAAVRAGECHVLNICVSQENAGRGYAKALLRRLLRLATTLRAHTAYLEVRPSNHVAINLYRRAGFRQIGVRRDYYPARVGREDALVLSKSLGKA
jgi:ribosomal-protein-alanine N-acetyltransferase